MLKPSNKKFGITFSIIFFIASLLIYNKSYTFLSSFLALTSAILFFIAYFYSTLLENLNTAWFKLGIILGKIMNPIILSLIFFTLILPIAIFFKIIGRDELKKNKTYNSLWTKFEQRPYDKDYFNNQF